MGYVYLIKNIKNNKIYVGSTVEVEKRMRSHRNGLVGGYHDNWKLQKDFDLYGDSVFEYMLLHETNVDEERYFIEADIIEQLRTYEYGYNLSVDGRGMYILTDDTREKMRKNTIGKNNPFYGRKHSEETKRMLSEKASKRVGYKNPFYGKTHSQKSIDKMNKSFQKLKDSGWVNPQKGIPKSDEAKRNNALAQPKRKSVYAEGKKYMSISECAKDIGVVRATVRNRINSNKYPNYYYIND